MQCEDNSKLRTPLPEVCQTTDIGCVPITDGKPGCAPQPDELPIAFDPSTTTLWLFSCKTHEWLEFQKFTMCQLEALNLDNIRDICDALNIGVNYGGSGECKQGTITLRELAERILECLTLETKIITIGEGEGNKVKISIEGLPLDPVYVTGRNIWSEGGSGTEADPLRIATYDPICKWEIKSQADVDAANTKHLGACLDGKMSRVPFPPKVCELPSRNQAQVDASTSVELIACLDGKGSKIPYPAMPCSYPQITPEEMMAASDKDFIVCVNGQNLKVPVPYNLYEASPCASPLYTIPETQAAGGRITILACDGGQTIRIPIEGSAFFSYNTDWKYPCVPQTNGVPVGAPAEGTGPLRMDCDNTLWVWDCEGSGWRNVIDGIQYTTPVDIVASIPDPCANLRLKGWDYSNNNVCAKPVNFTLEDLYEAINLCNINATKCVNPIRYYSRSNFPLRTDRRVSLKKVKLSARENEDFYSAIYNVRSRQWEAVSGGASQSYANDRGEIDESADFVWGVKGSDIVDDAGKNSFTITNDYDCKCFYNIRNSVQLYQRAKAYTQDFHVTVIGICSSSPTSTYSGIANVHCEWQQREDKDNCVIGNAPTRRFAVVNWHSKSNGNNHAWAGNDPYTVRYEGISPVPCYGELEPGESITFYMHTFLIVSSTTQNLGKVDDIVTGFGSYCDYEKIRGVRIPK